ncbi:hypothetical protein ES703_52577 [subsurface metagenome]
MDCVKNAENPCNVQCVKDFVFSITLFIFTFHEIQKEVLKMPGFDGTGPAGLGPMTGRGMGYCALPLSNPGVSRVPYGYAGIYGAQLPTTDPYAPVIPYRRPWFGMRPGRGRGFGRGRGRGR